MIDMRSYFTHSDYLSTVEKFKSSFDEANSNCKDYWGTFTKLQKEISNNKCPICEVTLSKTKDSIYEATLDHFRPQAKEMYPYLKCVPENYILMCSLCNTTYKDDEFPLFDELKSAKGAKNISETRGEQALLFNPTEVDPLDFLELVFIQTQQGGILELKRNTKTIPRDKTSYVYQQCKTMIEMFGLGYCHKDTRTDTRKVRNLETDKMDTISVKGCRIDILTKHYGTFIELAKEVKKAVETRNQKSLKEFLKNKNRKKDLERYGFYRFIIKNQFTIK